MKFYIGLHIPAHAGKFDNSFISISVLKKRVSDICPKNWILDSEGFSRISKHGEYDLSPKEYVIRANRWSRCGNMVAAVSQDYMCEQFILDKWGRTVKDHQHMTVERYYQIMDENPIPYIMPVLQGYTADDYLNCVDMYGFPKGTYVGIGSVCKRNGNVKVIADILRQVKDYSDLEIHGFGLKKTALLDKEIRSLLHSSDSMAWSFAARAEANFTSPNGANDPNYALRYYEQIRSIEGVT